MEKPDEPITELPEIKKGHDVDDLARRIQSLEAAVADLIREVRTPRDHHRKS